MYVALTWNTDAAHARLHRWQVHVLDRWAREDEIADRPTTPGLVPMLHAAFAMGRAADRVPR